MESLLDLWFLGVLGLWRWVVWFIKVKISSLFVEIGRDLDSDQIPKLYSAVALTVKGEPPEHFNRVLAALVSEGMNEVCITFAGESETTIPVLKSHMAKYPEVLWKWAIATRERKRGGLYDAIQMVSDKADVIYLMDSDTILGKGVSAAVHRVFTDPWIGGAVVAQRVYQPQNWVQHQFDLMLAIRYEHEIRGQAVGRRVSCLSGRCSVYRASALFSIAPQLLTEKWAGIAKTGGGEDKCLTTAMHDVGYYTTFISSATVYTRAEPDFHTFTIQRLRWGRNSWFDGLRAILSRRWYWQSPILNFYILDRMISAFTVLLPKWFLFWAVVHQKWAAAALILVWWFSSRLLKAWPYFAETRRWAQVFPFVLVSMFVGDIKIYGLFSLSEKGWLTRGEKSRKRRNWFAILGLFLTELLMFLLAYAAVPR